MAKGTVARPLRTGILLLVLVAVPFHASAQGSGPTFEPGACPIDVPDHLEIDCGTLTVPEDADDPESGSVRLPVIIVRSPGPNPQPDPIVFTEGGPGYSSLDSVWWLSRSPYVEDRDIIVLEQRGNLYAEPSLACDISMWREEAEGDTACLDSLRADGIDPTHYTTQHIVDDIEVLRRALDIEAWNLYGTSYSTRLMLLVLQEDPDGVRAAVLDSVGPPDENRYLHDPEHSVRSLHRMLEDCAADPVCSEAYPDLEARFYELYSRLNADPVTFRVVYDREGRRLDEPLTAEISGYTLLEWMVADAFYDPAYGRTKTSYLPLLIDQVARGRELLLRPWFMEGLTRWSSPGFAWGLYFAINCQNDYPWVAAGGLPASVEDYPALEGYTRHGREVEICSLWDLPPAPLPLEPVRSDVPTLVLAGSYDPITPPEWGRTTAEHLERAYYFEFPAGGHGVGGESDCARGIIRTFLADPEREPSATCIATEPRPEFVPPEEVAIAPGFYRSLADINLGAPQGKPWLEALVMGGLLLFAGEILFLILAGIVRLARRREREAGPDPIARLAQPLAGLVALLGISIPVLMTDINRVLNDDPIMRYFGLPGGYPPVIALGVVAPLLTLLCILLVIVTVLAWLRRSRSMAGRLQLSLVAVAAVLFTVLIGRWGLMFLLV